MRHSAQSCAQTRTQRRRHTHRHSLPNHRLPWVRISWHLSKVSLQENIISNGYFFLHPRDLSFIWEELGVFCYLIFSCCILQTFEVHIRVQCLGLLLLWFIDHDVQEMQFPWQNHSVLWIDTVMNWSSNWTKFSCGHLPTCVAASTQLHAHFLMPLPDRPRSLQFCIQPDVNLCSLLQPVYGGLHTSAVQRDLNIGSHFMECNL